MGRPSAKKAKKKAAKRAEREVDPEVAEKRKRVPWTAEQVEALKGGVDKFGGEENRWARILEDADFKGPLGGRSNVDLKDKWRNLVKAGDAVSPTKSPSKASRYLKPSSEAPKTKSKGGKQRGGKAKAAPESEGSSSSSSSSGGISSWELGKRRRPAVEEDEDDEDEDDEEDEKKETKEKADNPFTSFWKSMRSIF